MRRRPHAATDFADEPFERRRTPRPERFLGEMNCVVPWAKLAAAIALVSPKTEALGIRPWASNASCVSILRQVLDCRDIQH